MTDKPVEKTTLPALLSQNPSPVGQVGQGRILTKRAQVDNIMAVFFQMLPSNYVSQVQGPFYTLQFQAVAEVIAELQISAQETFADSDYDYMRPEFLFQLLGSLVFPDATSDGYPNLKGDLTYRDFLKRMVGLLLQGATKSSIEGGLDLLSDATWSVIEKSLASRTEKKKVWNPTKGVWEQKPGSVWDLDHQFEFEVLVSSTDAETGTQRFPQDPFVLQENVRLVLRALKPAHTLYEYRNLFTEVFGNFFSESQRWDLSNYYYEDFRKYCSGVKNIQGTSGVTWSDKTLFSDVQRDFSSVLVGADLTVTSGPNGVHSGGVEGTSGSTDFRHVGRYRVVDILTFPVPTDSTAQSYTTSPTGLTGKATVADGSVYDSNQNFGLAVEGETLTFTTGPNQGTYRLKTLLGLNGGPVGHVEGPATAVRVAPSLLRVDRRMKVAVSGQSYQVAIDRLGVQEDQVVEQEDATLYFVL